MFINVSNNTSEQIEDKSSRAWFALLLILVALFGHALVFLAFYRERNLRTLQNIIIVNLSVADFLFSAIVPPTHVVRLLRKETTLSEIPCHVTGVGSLLFCLASINTLTFISVERYMAINYPMKHRRFFDSKLVKVVLIAIWCWSAALSAFPFLKTKYIFLKTFFHCSPDWSKDLGTTLTLASLGIGSPLATLIYCNFHIVRALRKSRQIHTNHFNTSQQRSIARYQRERTMSILTITVVITFTVCWAPYCAAMLCLASEKCTFSENFMFLALILSILNSSCNPLIYGLLNKNFRNAFKNILTCYGVPKSLINMRGTTCAQSRPT